MDFFEKYYSFSLRFLSYRPRSIKEVKESLEKKKAPPEVIERIISLLLEQKFLNDEEFARAWIDSRLRSRPKALSILKQELSQKGIGREIIEDVIPDRKVTDTESIKPLIEKAKRKYAGLDPKERKQKMANYLARRGYSWDIISPLIDDRQDEEV
jgi:regulatory protein